MRTGRRDETPGTRGLLTTQRVIHDGKGIVMSPIESQPFEPVVTEYAGYVIEPHMVLVQTCTAGICQSDRRIMMGAKASSLTAGFRLVLGHELGGRVVATGSGEEGLRANDKVVVLPHWTCGRCHSCRSNRPNLCRKLRHAGFHYHGGFSRYGCFPTPHHLPGR